MQMSELPTIDQIPKPEERHIQLVEVKAVSVPHPYCITPKHVAYAADHHSGFLDDEAIKGAEKNGAVCDFCRQERRKVPFDEHKQQVTLFIRVPYMDATSLNKVKGLNKYLVKIKPVLQELKIDGVAFVKQK